MGRRRIKKIKSWLIDRWSNLKIGTSNLLKWSKTIYNDRDWDFDYFLIILKKKLEFKEKYFRNSTISTSSEKVVSEIHYALELIEKLQKDEYVEERMKLHREKWGDFHYSWVDDDPSSTEKIKLHRSVIVYEKSLTEEDQARENEEFYNLIIQADLERAEDRKKLFLHIADHLEGWWD